MFSAELVYIVPYAGVKSPFSSAPSSRRGSTAAPSVAASAANSRSASPIRGDKKKDSKKNSITKAFKLNGKGSLQV
jgi:hypothetical protein